MKISRGKPKRRLKNGEKNEVRVFGVSEEDEEERVRQIQRFAVETDEGSSRETNIEK